MSSVICSVQRISTVHFTNSPCTLNLKNQERPPPAPLPHSCYIFAPSTAGTYGVSSMCELVCETTTVHAVFQSATHRQHQRDIEPLSVTAVEAFACVPLVTACVQRFCMAACIVVNPRGSMHVKETSIGLHGSWWQIGKPK